MRVFKDLDLVEQLGSGIPRILQVYDKDFFQFSESFLRIVLLNNQDDNGNEFSGQVGGQAGGQAGWNNNIEQIQKEFGVIAKRLDISSIGNKEFIESNYPLFIFYLEEGFGITSGNVI